MAAESPIADLHCIRHRRIRRSPATAMLPVLLLTGWLLFWAAPAGAVSYAVPTIVGAEPKEEAVTPQDLHDQCASRLQCEGTLTAVQVKVSIPPGGGADCEGPGRVGYASNIGTEGHLTTSWPGGDWEQNCYAMEGCPEYNTSPCSLEWTLYPFAYAGGGTRDCTHSEFAVEVSLEYMGNGEGYSKAYPVTIKPPKGCKEEGGGKSGGGTSGNGTSGNGATGNGTSGNGTSDSCITTATCVIPLNYSGVIRGQPYVVHADGSRAPLQDVTSLKSGDWIKTGSNGVARWGIGYSNGVGIACAMWAAPNTGLVFTTLILSTQGMFFWSAVLAKGEVVVQQAVVPVRLDTSNAIVKTASAKGASKASAAAAGATFTIQKTGSSSLVQVYGGSVTVSDAHGGHTVVVRAGFQSSVERSGPPSRARRFKAPKHRFWT